jgi:hypothetical protein
MKSIPDETSENEKLIKFSNFAEFKQVLMGLGAYCFFSSFVTG